MVIFDANFVLLLLQPNVKASVDKARERVAYLVGELDRKQERIVIPTPAMSELLMRSGSVAGAEYLRQITKSSRFKLASFDQLAAIELAEMVRVALGKKAKFDGSKGSWAKVNFDRQIAAIGKVEQAHTIYTDDGDLAKFAEKVDMKVITLADLELPPCNEPLFEGVPDGNEEEILPPLPELGLDSKA